MYVYVLGWGSYEGGGDGAAPEASGTVKLLEDTSPFRVCVGNMANLIRYSFP